MSVFLAYYNFDVIEISCVSSFMILNSFILLYPDFFF